MQSRINNCASSLTLAAVDAPHTVEEENQEGRHIKRGRFSARAWRKKQECLSKLIRGGYFARIDPAISARASRFLTPQSLTAGIS
jgi:hypothetical protein